MTGIDYLIDLNRRHSEDFNNKTLQRRQYRSKHPTEIAVFKCMDGRLNLPIMTETPMGIILPFRNVGGIFNLGWAFLSSLVKEWVDYANKQGRDCLVLTTHHFSKGDEHRGCAGFSYDTEAARASSRKLRDQFNSVFNRDTVFAAQVGIETDHDGLIFYGTEKGQIDLSEFLGESSDLLRVELQKLYPDFPSKVINDLLPLAEGNIAHIKEIVTARRPAQDIEHREWVIAVGRGFDWFHELNTGLIISPLAPDYDRAVITAAKVIKSNIDAGRIDPKNGVVILTSAPFRDPAGPERNMAKVKAEFLQGHVTEVVKNNVPELIPFLQHLTVTVNLGTRAFDYVFRE